MGLDEVTKRLALHFFFQFPNGFSLGDEQGKQ